MDKIHVSDAALESATEGLRQFNDQSETISSSCIEAISSLLSELDDTFRKEIERYIDAIKSINAKVQTCTSENISALRERIERIEEYETHKYRPRNLG